MEELSERELGERAVELVKAHFDAVNRADADVVRAQLFQPTHAPPMPLETYVAKLIALRPFDLKVATSTGWRPPHETQHGVVATVWVTVEFTQRSLGSRTERLPVWWFPDTSNLLIAVRRHDWIEESRSGVSGK